MKKTYGQVLKESRIRTIAVNAGDKVLTIDEAWDQMANELLQLFVKQVKKKARSKYKKHLGNQNYTNQYYKIARLHALDNAFTELAKEVLKK